MKREGPLVTIKRSCFNCRYEESDYYAFQSDSGHNVYCVHGGQRRPIGDTTWITPDWCPFVAGEKSATSETKETS